MHDHHDLHSHHGNLSGLIACHTYCMLLCTVLIYRYEDKGRIRPVIHRASTVEIIVPYGDPRSPFHKKCAFDVVVRPDL